MAPPSQSAPVSLGRADIHRPDDPEQFVDRVRSRIRISHGTVQRAFPDALPLSPEGFITPLIPEPRIHVAPAARPELPTSSLDDPVSRLLSGNRIEASRRTTLPPVGRPAQANEARDRDLMERESRLRSAEAYLRRRREREAEQLYRTSRDALGNRHADAFSSLQSSPTADSLPSPPRPDQPRVDIIRNEWMYGRDRRVRTSSFWDEEPSALNDYGVATSPEPSQHKRRRLSSSTEDNDSPCLYTLLPTEIIGQVNKPAPLSLDLHYCDGGAYFDNGYPPTNVLHGNREVYCTKKRTCNLVFGLNVPPSGSDKVQHPLPNDYFMLKRLVIEVPGRELFNSPLHGGVLFSSMEDAPSPAEGGWVSNLDNIKGFNRNWHREFNRFNKELPNDGNISTSSTRLKADIDSTPSYRENLRRRRDPTRRLPPRRYLPPRVTMNRSLRGDAVSLSLYSPGSSPSSSDREADGPTWARSPPLPTLLDVAGRQLPGLNPVPDGVRPDWSGPWLRYEDHMVPRDSNRTLLEMLDDGPIPTSLPPPPPRRSAPLGENDSMSPEERRFESTVTNLDRANRDRLRNQALVHYLNARSRVGTRHRSRNGSPDRSGTALPATLINNDYAVASSDDDMSESDDEGVALMHGAGCIDIPRASSTDTVSADRTLGSSINAQSISSLYSTSSGRASPSLSSLGTTPPRASFPFSEPLAIFTMTPSHEASRLVIEFKTPVAARFLLLKMFASRGGRNIDIMSVKAEGTQGGRTFMPSLEMM